VFWWTGQKYKVGVYPGRVFLAWIIGENPESAKFEAFWDKYWDEYWEIESRPTRISQQNFGVGRPKIE
jgi:hypothetical protein